MVAEEITVSLKVASRHLKDAESALRRGIFYDCVYHSASAVENAANAMILSLGGRVPHTHRDAEALASIVARVRPELLKDKKFKLMIEGVSRLQRHVVASRYPIEVEEGKFLPPEEFYRRGDAVEALDDARSVVDAIKHYVVHAPK